MTDEIPARATGWGWILAAGIVLIIAGIVAILDPFAAGFAAGLLLSWAMIVGGAFAMAAGFTNLRREGAWLYVVLGLLGLLAGLLVMFNPFAGVLSLVWALGIWLAAGGLLELVAAFRGRRGRGWLILLGIVDLALGLLLAVMNSWSALFFLAVAIGLSLIFRGVGSVIFALALRRSREIGADGAACRQHREELLDEALEESFPASDVPSIARPPSGRCD